MYVRNFFLQGWEALEQLSQEAVDSLSLEVFNGQTLEQPGIAEGIQL